MKKVLSRINNIENYILLITFPLMVIFVMLSTVFRYFELGSLTWAEEASRYLMIWLAFAGIGLGFKNNTHLGLSFIVKKFNFKVQKFFHYLRALLILTFGLIVTYYSMILVNTQIMNPQISPGLGIPIWYAYVAVLFGGILIIVRTIQMSLVPFTEKVYSEDVQL